MSDEFLYDLSILYHPADKRSVDPFIQALRRLPLTIRIEDCAAGDHAENERALQASRRSRRVMVFLTADIAATPSLRAIMRDLETRRPAPKGGALIRVSLKGWEVPLAHQDRDLITLTGDAAEDDLTLARAALGGARPPGAPWIKMNGVSGLMVIFAIILAGGFLLRFHVMSMAEKPINEDISVFYYKKLIYLFDSNAPFHSDDTDLRLLEAMDLIRKGAALRPEHRTLLLNQPKAESGAAASIGVTALAQAANALQNKAPLQAIDILTQARATQPEHASLAIGLALAQHAAGQESLAMLEQAQVFAKTALEKSVRDGTAWRRYLRAADLLDGGYQEKRNLRGKRANLERVVALLTLHKSDHPDGRDWSRTMLLSLMQLGDLTLATWDYPAADAAFTQALALMEQLQKTRPNSESRAVSFFVVLKQLGRTAELHMRDAEAVAYYDRSLTFVPHFPQAQASDATLRRMHAEIWLGKSNLARRGGDPIGARNALRQGLAIYDAMRREGVSTGLSPLQYERLQQALKEAEAGTAASPQ